MPRHFESRVLPYSPEQLYQLVMDIERYPEFLPWCVGARITASHEDGVSADVLVGYKMLREKFSSRVRVIEHEKIDVEYLSGPLKNLRNSWRFSAVPDGTLVEFYLEFEFASRLLQQLITMFFDEALRRMVAAFEKRAAEIYPR